MRTLIGECLFGQGYLDYQFQFLAESDFVRLKKKKRIKLTVAGTI